MKNKCKILCGLLVLLILMGCSNNNNDKTIKLTFSEYCINEAFLFNEEISELANLYCEYYRNVISLYNHALDDDFNIHLEFYEEYEKLSNISDEMHMLCDNMTSDDSKKPAASLAVDVASTNYLLATFNATFSKEGRRELAEKLYKDIVDSYEHICDGE